MVLDVRLTYDPVKDVVLAPVRYEVEPERVIGVGKRIYKTDAEIGRCAPQKGAAREPAERQPDHRAAECRA